MEKDIIVQFVCFVTNLGFEEFAAKWEHYASQFVAEPNSMVLQQMADTKTRNKYKYVSQHRCKAEDFRFAFMKERKSEHFPEHTAKVIQAGGYRPLQYKRLHSEDSGVVKVIAFIGHNENDLDFYHGLACKQMNIYEAYYESCAYGYVMEFFIPGDDAPALLEQLKTRTGVEAAIYKECPVLLHG